MDNDDALVGRILNRREILTLLGGAGALFAVGCSDKASPAPATAETAATTGAATGSTTTSAAATATATGTAVAAATTTPQCIVSPELTEGPYFVDEKLNRSDIRTDPSDGAVSAGALLKLTLNVFAAGANGCTPLPKATVDVWHCDAFGVYSDATDRSFNTTGKMFLRGYQDTDANGQAVFTTIYPGWYQGRAVHIHFKVRGATPAGGSFEFTSQFFFDEAFTDNVYLAQPYAAKGKRTVLNSADSIYRQSSGQTQLIVTKSGSGYESTFDIGIRL
ncbi:MAG: intradiol ring-cleavage dioxygenase [Dehalococcoidia bacterium]